MEYRQLGKTDIKVSSLCLGTMTWGEQNSQDEALAQLDYAFECGINFIDTAEMYAIPPRAETYTKTEQYIGKWDKLKSQRSKIILATKIAGPSSNMSYIRGGSQFTREQLIQAVNGSLERLGVDYIDLYQLHWPERNTNYFGQRSYTHKENDEFTPLEHVLEVLAEIQKSGKVRHFGLSNETPWGTMKYLEASSKYDYPRMASIQNPYNLLNRTYETAMAEVSHREQIGLLAYSPLGFGTLSGKYLNGQRPAGARLSRWSNYSRYSSEQAQKATAEYANIAKKHGMSPAQMALAFVTSRSFTTSNIIGATNLDQLKENIESADINLSDELLAEINLVHEMYTNPCP